jgi:hypothetical protein
MILSQTQRVGSSTKPISAKKKVKISKKLKPPVSGQTTAKSRKKKVSIYHLLEEEAKEGGNNIISISTPSGLPPRVNQHAPRGK